MGEVQVGAAQLGGFLDIPPEAKGVVFFVHGSGSSRYSPRNQQVAAQLREAGLGTLLMDLLKPEEDTQENRFDISLLADRVVEAVGWLQLQTDLPIGLIGSSTGAAAALVAATRISVGAVVSRGGRPDLAADSLAAVEAPTLLIVGGADLAVLELNRQALALLETEKRLEIVPEATHLFEEPGTLEKAADLSAKWFLKHL
jgi:putative phosphoribosyl transferase